MLSAMKKILFLVFLIFISGSTWATGSFMSVAGRPSVEVGMKPETVKRKKNKGYKKPKKKKFLGIFKRKSSCDCPKH